MKRNSFLVDIKTLMLILFCSNSVFAGRYSPEDFYQTVHFLNEGPAVMIAVENDFSGSQFVLAYKNSGYLTQPDMGSIDAVIVTKCDGKSHSSTVTLGKEWHGTGYMSAPFLETYIDEKCLLGSSWDVEIAFVDQNGVWDSKSGSNYHFSKWKLLQSEVVYHTNQGPDPDRSFFEINLAAWDFIIAQMRK
jgi:hypothetical protein